MMVVSGEVGQPDLQGGRMSVVRLFTVLLLATFTTSGTSTTQRAVPATAPAGKAVDAARAFLATLNDQQRAKVVLPLSTTTRTIWSNLPTGITMQVGANERNGLKLGTLTAAQQDAALALVAAALSRTGFQKVMNI